MKYLLLENGRIGKLKKVGLRTRLIRKNISKSKIREGEMINLTEIHTFVACEEFFSKTNGKKNTIYKRSKGKSTSRGTRQGYG